MADRPVAMVRSRCDTPGGMRDLRLLRVFAVMRGDCG